jgi:hypothetical protein
MIYKDNYIRKQSTMSNIKFCIYFIQQRFRSLSLVKMILLIIFTFLFLIYFFIFHREKPWCDPEQHLYWFCSWPDPETTTCSYQDHFPTTSEAVIR